MVHKRQGIPASGLRYKDMIKRLVVSFAVPHHWEL